MNVRAGRPMRQKKTPAGYFVKSADARATADRVYRVKSRTIPHLEYEVYFYANGDYQCDCFGWLFRGYCSHIEELGR